MQEKLQAFLSVTEGYNDPKNPLIREALDLVAILDRRNYNFLIWFSYNVFHRKTIILNSFKK